VPSFSSSSRATLGSAGATTTRFSNTAPNAPEADDVIAPIGMKAVRHFAHDPVYKEPHHDFEKLSLSEPSPSRRSTGCARVSKTISTPRNTSGSTSCSPVIRQLDHLRADPLPAPAGADCSRRSLGPRGILPALIRRDSASLIHAFLPDYLAAVFYDRLLDSELSEQASRRTAMDNANDNADRYARQTAAIEYNKARQNAITQEITEVVSGSWGANSKGGRT
jgi:hypothetical protein